MRKLLTNIIVLVIILLTSTISSNSQSISVIRTDVDSTRSDFVTATYLFSFEIKLEDIKGVNNASFKLQYNQADVIHFSGARIGDFGLEGTEYSFSKSPNSDEAQLSISVFSGKPLGESDFDNPSIITLEFVVTPSADNDEQVRFSFPTALATQYIDGEDQIVTLASTSVVYDIHGFVDVWPGDANNDGTAEIDDMATIGLYIEHQNRYSGTRSFKRKNASTNWYAQRVLVWDEEDATYADADGDGDISVSDGLVVFLNESKVHETNKDHYPILHKLDILRPNLQNESTIAIPIHINASDEFFAVKGRIENLNENFKIKGIESAGLFYNTNEAVLNHIKEDNSLEFLIGSFDNNYSINTSGIIANLILEKTINRDLPDYYISELTAYKRNGNSFNLYSITDINTNDILDYKIIENQLIVDKGNLNVNGIYDLIGKTYQINSTSISNETIINLSFLKAGCYFVSLQDGKNNYSIPVILSQ